MGNIKYGWTSFFRDLIITDIIINAKVHSVKFISDKVCIVAVMYQDMVWGAVGCAPKDLSACFLLVRWSILLTNSDI